MVLTIAEQLLSVSVSPAQQTTVARGRIQPFTGGKMAVFGSHRKRALAGIALTGAAALVLAGCTTDGGDQNGDGGSESGGTITIATTNAFTSFNGDTPQANLDTN